MNKFFMKVTIFLLALFASESAAPQDSYNYIDPLKKFNVRLEVMRNIVSQGPYSDISEFCGNEENQYCFSHPEYWFAVPKDISTETTSWVNGAYRYCLGDKVSEYTILGRMYSDVFLIGSIDKGIKCESADSYQITYVYSRKEGLILFKKHWGESESTILVAENLPGFGSITPNFYPNGD